MMKRGALIHWTLSDSLLERQSLLLLGASLGEAAPVEVPPSAAGIKLAEFRCIKVLITPLTKSSCRIRWVSHVDLKAGSLPQALVSMVTKKVAGSLLSTLVREAQKATNLEAEAEASGAAPVIENVYLRRINEERSDFYSPMSAMLRNYFDMFGEATEDSP